MDTKFKIYIPDDGHPDFDGKGRVQVKRMQLEFLDKKTKLFVRKIYSK